MTWFSLGSVGAAASSFAPTDLTDLSLWYDADDAASITEAGSGISEIDDKSVNDIDVTQTDDTERPSVGTANGNDSFEFDGVDEVIHNLSAGQGFDLSPVTVGIVFTPDNTSDSVNFLNIRDSSFGRIVGFNQSTDDVGVLHGGNQITLSNILTAGETRWIIYRAEDGDQNTLLDDDSSASATVATLGTGTIDDVILGGSNPNGGFDGHIHEIVLYTRFLPTSERTQLGNYFNNKWTIS